MLRGRVAGLVADAADPADAGGVHDHAGALLAHDGEDLLEAEEHAAQVDRDDLVELRGREVLGEVLAALDAGVVEEAVDAAEALDGLAHVGVDVGLLRHVGEHGEDRGVGRRGRHGGDGVDQAALGDVHEGELRALGGEAHGGGAAEAGSSAGDEDDLVGEAGGGHGVS
ncbi:hypothetical protein MAFF212519_22430 [Clavibacter michiganensis]